MKHKIRLARIESQLHDGRQQGHWDLSLLSDEALEALAGFVRASPTDEELMAMIPEEMLKELERCYRGQDEQA